MKKHTGIHGAFTSLTMAMAVMAAVAMDVYADYPEGYYDSLEGKCGAELMQAVKKVARNHTVISYGNSTWDVFRESDVKTVNGVDYYWDMYSNNLVQIQSQKPDATVMNIEHAVANSWWGKTENDAYKDIFHLNPSDSKANSAKGNYPLAEVSSTNFDNGVTKVGYPKSGQGDGARYCYEPADQYKGDMARAFMYIFTIYDDLNWREESGYGYMYDTSLKTLFKTWAANLLVRWNTQDPPDNKEFVRNEAIYRHQHNRNPFIDLPALADHIWGSKSSVPFSLTGNTDPKPDPDPDPDPTPDPGPLTSASYLWLSESSSTMDSDWTIENITLPKADGWIWQWKSYQGLYYLNGSAYIDDVNYASKGYAWGPVVSFENVKEAKVKFDHTAKFQTTVRDLCGLVVRDVETGEITMPKVPTWPTAGNWNFVSSGDIDLAQYSGKNVQIGFKYESNTSGADTWEVRNVRLDLTKSTTGIDNLAPEEGDDSHLVEVWGNNILAPRGARIFDLNGREYEGLNLNPGLYIVVKPGFKKAIKVRI